MRAKLSKGVSISFLSFFILITVLSVQIIPVAALLPRFTGHIISGESSFINESPRITVFISFTDANGNDISGLIGTITVYLMWSRDKSEWHSIEMSVSAIDTYFTDIPAQDGSDNWQYDAGVGVCYWYARITNNKNEEGFYYSSANPNTEIYFFDPEGGTTTITDPEDLQGNVTQNIPPLVEIPLAIITELFDPTGNPFVKLTVIGIVVVIVYMWTTRGKGFAFLQGLFRRG